MSKKTVIYILPHNDDEIFVIPKIREDLKNQNNLIFFYLMKDERRLNESITFLTGLGVKQENIISLGKKLNIHDGSVYLHLSPLFNEFCHQLKQLGTINEIICPAYEGGHHDHDATSVLARRLAKEFSSQVVEFYLYNGYGTSGKFYNVAFPINVKKAYLLSYRFIDRVSLFFVPFIYRSQLLAMLGLLPFLFFKSIVRPLTLNYLQNDFLEIVAHTETPLYERWPRITHKEFMIAYQIFINRHLR